MRRHTLLQTSLQILSLKNFQRFCVEIRNFKSNATRAREGNLK